MEKDKLQNVQEMTFRMTDNEKDCLLRWTKKSKHYLEFGSGGSTQFVLKNSKAKVYSVESSSDWINYMRSFEIIRKSESKKRLNLLYVNIGKTGDWGYPLQPEKIELYPNYSSEIFSLVPADKIDTVLVDGRFRVACIFNTILNCNQDVTIIVHDFVNRPQYHVVLNYVDVIDSVDTMVVLKIKNNVNKVAVEELYNIYKAQPN